MKAYRSYFIALIAGAGLIVAACSSGGDGGGGTPPVAAPLAGVFVDSPVAGLGWKALPSGLSGKTDATGHFQYRQGDKVQFHLDGRNIGASVDGAGKITAHSLFGATTLIDSRVLRCSRLLLTLGGGAPVGGVIQLPTTMPPTLAPVLDFTPANVNFDTTVLPGITLVSDANATTHLQSSFSTVTVNFAGAGSGTVSSTPIGINSCATTCSNVFINGDSVTLTATGSGFAGWGPGTGNATVCNSTTTTTCTFTPTGDSSITATFNPPPPPTLTVSKVGTGTGTVGCSTTGGPPFTTPCAASYPSGTVVTMQATADAGSIFAGWSLGTGNAQTCNGTIINCSMTLTAITTVTATFDVIVVRTVTSPIATANGGGGTVQCSAGGGAAGPCTTYPSGTVITMTALPDAVSNFTGWTNGSGNANVVACNGTIVPCNFTLTANSTLTANFNRPTLTVVVAGTGTVNSNPGGITNCTTNCSAAFNKGTLITLTASAGLSSWSGGGCSGTGNCPVTLNADTTVTANFQQVAAIPNFKFIAAPGRELLAINPASPATPTPVQVGGNTVLMPNLIGQGGDRGATVLETASYNAATTSFTNMQPSIIIFVSGGKMYKASAAVTDGAPGTATNVPVQVSNVTTAQPCGTGSALDLSNTTNRIIGFVDAGGDNNCTNGNEHLVLMHLNDGVGTAPVSFPVGINPPGDTFVFDLATGGLTQALVTDSTTGNLLWFDNTLAPPSTITGGAGVGPVQTVAMQNDKVFLASNTKLYIYTPSTHTLSGPVVTADAGKTWVGDSDGNARVSTDSSAIFLVQDNGDVYRVPLTTNAGQTITTKHFTAVAGTVAARVEQTPNRIMIMTGTAPFGPGGANACFNANPQTCNNGIIGVHKTIANSSVTIETAASSKVIFDITPFNSYVLYTVNNTGALARIEDASAQSITVSGIGSGWSKGTQANSVNLTTLQQLFVNLVIVQNISQAPNGAIVKVVTSPTGTPVTIGTVSDPTNLLSSPPFFQESDSTALLGFAQLLANPANTQPFLANTTVNSLTKITTPGAAAPWREIGTD